MVKPLRACSLAALASLAACGSLYDGSYQGDARFVLNGSIVSLADAPVAYTGPVLVHVAWEMILAPLPPPTSGGSTSANGSTTVSNPANPNPGSTPSTPSTTGGSDGAVGLVHFPAPMSLSLYEVPAAGNDPAALAVGTVVIFYDLDGDGVYSNGDAVAGTAQAHRLVYTDLSLPAGDFASFNTQLDNAAALTKGYALAAASCLGSGGTVQLHAIPNTSINLTAGPLPTCP